MDKTEQAVKAQGAEAELSEVPAKGDFIIVTLVSNGVEKITKISPAKFTQSQHQFQVEDKPDGKKGVEVRTKLQYDAEVFLKHPTAKIDGKDAGLLIEAKVRLSEYATMERNRNRAKSPSATVSSKVEGF